MNSDEIRPKRALKNGTASAIIKLMTVITAMRMIHASQPALVLTYWIGLSGKARVRT